MDLKNARHTLNRRFERKVNGLTAEETERKARFDKLGERVLALYLSDRVGIESYSAVEERGAYPGETINISAIFVTEEHREADIMFSLSIKRSADNSLVKIEVDWMDAGSHEYVTEELHVSNLYDFPEDAERALNRIGQSITALETASDEALYPNPRDYSG